MAELRHPNLVQCVAAIHDDAGRLAAYGMPRGQHDLWDELQYVAALLSREEPCAVLFMGTADVIALLMSSRALHLEQVASCCSYNARTELPVQCAVRGNGIADPQPLAKNRELLRGNFSSL